MTNIILIVINSIALAGAILWSINDPSWESLISLLTLLATLIGLIFARSKKSRKSSIMKQKVRNSSIGIQVGRDININK